MSELINAVVLGVVQGLTEFLPVSSSGHLEIAKYLLGDQRMPSQSLLLTVVLHFATALSTVIVFRHDLVNLTRGLTGPDSGPSRRFAWGILISMIPAAAVGVLFESEIESLFDQQLLLVGSMLALTGLLLLLADRARTTDKEVGLLEALIIGVSQAIAILPGISRSGATISTSVMLGVDRAAAARFSFLMVVPLIFGKMAKLLLDNFGSDSLTWEPGLAGPLAAGFVAALVTGWIACTWMIRLVKASQLWWFSAYCFVMAVLVIAESALGWWPAAQ